ncbi:MAG: N-acetylmuramoyl-L-alanine amidase [bacterium]
MANNNRKLSNFGIEFINFICSGGDSISDRRNGGNRPEDNNLLKGTNGVMLYSNNPDTGNAINKEWTAEIKNDSGEIITENQELAPLLIQWFNKYGKEYDLDPNVLAAQCYILTKFRMWYYPNTKEDSTASGLVQMEMNDVYNMIVKNFNGTFSTSDFNTITNGLTDPDLQTSYEPQNVNPDVSRISRINRGILHQNIINNPKIMIKYYARIMSYLANNCNKLTSSTLFCYYRGSRYTSNTYSNVIKKAQKEKGETFTNDGLDHVLKVFGVLGDKANIAFNYRVENYKPKGYYFGYDELALLLNFDEFEANKAESSVYNITNLDDLTIVDTYSNYKFIYFPENQYETQSTSKNQIVLHHTVSGPGAAGDVGYWRDKGEKIATSFIITRDGGILQLFNTNFWAYHLGLETASNLKLNKGSIGIEIDSWGALVQRNGLWYPVANQDGDPIPESNVQIYPNKFRGYFGFEKYTTQQITAVQELILSIYNKFKIGFTNRLQYHDDMWDVSQNALNGKSGVWTHVSYRKDKSDCQPQPELISMLQGLNSIVVSNNSNYQNNSKAGSENRSR